MWVHVTGFERPSWMSGHGPTTNYLIPSNLVQGTRDVASRAMEFVGHPLAHLDVGRATDMAGTYARRRPVATAGGATFLAFLLGLTFGWVVKSITCRGKHIEEAAAPVVEYYRTETGERAGAPSDAS
jgi:hypothetical protein